MKDSERNRAVSLAGVLLGAAAGALLAALAFAAWVGLESSPDPATPLVTKAGPEFNAAVDDIKVSLALTRQEVNGLRMETAETNERLRLMSGDTADSGDRLLRTNLPPPYVAQVDGFFLLPAARSLLDPSHQNSNELSFGRPRFVFSDIVTVPYTLGVEQHYLLLEITVLDLYDLKLDVVWDSMEGK